MSVVITDFEDVRIGRHLAGSNLLANFTDINGQIKTSPSLFYSEIDLTKLQANQRGMLIRQSGGITNTSTESFYDEYNYTISIFSRAGLADSGITKGYAKQLRLWLKNNARNDSECIFDISTQGVSGPFITEDDRRVYEIGLLVRFFV